MNPGLVVKLRPAGPWRIGPDSGARNRVDVIYHSDSLYSAVTSAMARVGQLEEWLEATARRSNPAVCFSSCFPFLDEIGFIVPPRTIWPPTSPALMSARVRWKSARFVPLGIVQAILAGESLDEGHWSVDGPSECLVPAGRPGPFRTGVRWNAAVDRLTGATERHSTACLEFRSGAGLWTVVAFADDTEQARWLEPVKAAFRLLADTGFGGERSRGWGRSETPEFIEGSLPEMILGAGERTPEAVVAEPAAAEPAVAEPGSSEPLQAAVLAPDERIAFAQGLPEEPSPVPPQEEPPPEQSPVPEPPTEEPPTVTQPPLEEPPTGQPPVTEPPAEEPPVGEPQMAAPAVDEAPVVETAAPAVDEAPVVETAAPEPEASAPTVAPPAAEPAAAPEPPAPILHGHAHWLLSLFTPAASDRVDWQRGNYAVLARGGRIESPAGSGELKKQVHMLAEGSVVIAGEPPRGAAPDVAPEGFAHPVFRAGFAVAIQLPEVS